MRRLDQDVQFRSREAGPLTYTVAIPVAHMILAALGAGLVITLAATWLFGTDLVGAATTGGAVALLLAALSLTLRFGREVLWGLERATGTDIDQDGEVGQPEAHFVYVRQGTGRRDGELDDLRDFVQGCYTRGTARRAWVGSRLPTTGHTVTRGTYDRFCGVLVKAGVLEDLGNGRGTELACELTEAIDALGLD